MKTFIPAALCGAVALIGCAPIPLPGKIYVPASAADLPAKQPRGACLLNEPQSSAVRTIGDIEIEFFESRAELNNRNGQADFVMTVRRNDRNIGFKVDPARITLLDDGRLLKPEKLVKGSDLTEASLKFPAPSGDATLVTLSFQPGAIRIEGRAVNLAPISFKRIKDPTIYVFPCLPA